MEEEKQVETLFSKLTEEKKTGELLPLPEDFYQSAASVEEEKHRANEENKERYEHSRQALIKTIKAKRTQKILIYLAYGKPLPKPLPKEEEKLYRNIKKILQSDTKTGSITRLRITSQIPEIITPEGNRIGPFQQNEIVETENKGEVEFILNNKIGEEIT